MTIFDILNKCSNAYYNSVELYKLNSEDVKIIKETLNEEYQINQEITDEIYDNLYFHTQQKFPLNDFFNQVGIKDDGFGREIKFEIPMGSMVELKEGDLQEWKSPATDYVISEKLDGLSALLYYRDGKLVQASSRGDGYVGKDIFRHIKRLQNVVKIIPENEPQCFKDIEVRGEIIIPRDEIPVMLKELKEETGKENKNGRNSITGFLGSKVGPAAIARHAHFVAYDLRGVPLTQEIHKFEVLEQLGFETPKFKLMKAEDVTEENMISEVRNVKSNGKYECDGIIITQNITLKGYEGYETSSINPKRSRKFKIGAVENIGETIIKNIHWQVSKDGYFKPVLDIEPIVLVGATISNVTGNNYKYVIDNHLGIGAKIKISRSGDVIPKHLATLEPSDNIPLPEHYTLNETNVDLVYIEGSGDKKIEEDIQIQKNLYFMMTVGVDYAGEGNLKIFNDYYKEKYGYIPTPKELLIAPENDFIDSIGENGRKIYESLNEKIPTIKETTFMDSVGAFGRGISGKRLEKIYSQYQTLDVDVKELESVEGFAEKTITQYMKYKDNYKEWLNFCNEHGIKFGKVEKFTLSDKFKGLNVCWTGVRSKFQEDELENNGGKVCSSVTKDCNLVIVADINQNTGKAQKAREKGIKIISFEEAIEMFGGK